VFAVNPPVETVEVDLLPTPVVTTIAVPDPEAAVESFLAAWADRDYESMYSKLNPLVQESISFEDFSATYEGVWKAANLVSVETNIVSSLVNPQAAQVRYQVILNSAVVGPVTRETWMDLVRDGEEWRINWDRTLILPELADGNLLWMDMIVPTRANIYDRDGQALAVQTDVVALWIVPNEVNTDDRENSMLGIISQLLGKRISQILYLYDDLRAHNWYVHIGEVSLEDFQRYSGALEEISGIYWRVYPSRFHPNDGSAAHAIGYTSWIQEAQMDEYLSSGYRQDELVGQSGVEWAYEDQLRGKSGGTLYVTTAAGQVQQALGSSEAEPPQAVYSTIDRDLQQMAEDAIVGFNGSIVVLERNTGAVLALVSSPGFDTNLFDPQHPYRNDGIQAIYDNQNLPLFNRSTTGEYAPGSVFKVITMAAALESGYFETDTIYNCGHEFRELPGIVLYDWTYEKEKPAQGEITLMQALHLSCNPYFYHIGLELYNHGMPTAIPEMARAFGLGSPTGIEIGDRPGLVPDPEMKLEIFNEEWGPQDPVNSAIGQSFMLTTPIQVAAYMAAIGNGGTLFQPQLMSQIVNVEGEITSQFAPIVNGTLPITPDMLKSIQDAMVHVVREPKGTARNRFLGLNLNIAGKTGTATSGEYTESHSWFAGYTFEDNENKPDIAVAVMLEYQGEGSEWAAPIFRRIIEAYFYDRPYAVYPWESQIGVLMTATPTPGPDEEVDETQVP